jgi:drug/metabolite transporter (DMT)-like permease
MAKILFILVVAAIIESIGVALLSGGLKELHGAKEITVSEIARVLKSGATNGKILAGVGLEAVFFGALLYMLKVRDMSFVWPLTSLGFIVTTLAAQFILRENVSASRWAGVLMIAAGAFLISYSEHGKEERAAAAAAAASSTPLRPE